MTQTAIAMLDAVLGGALPGRLHLITGGPGSGKTSACLRFLNAGVARGERTALLTLDRPEDLRSHASHLGLDLRGPVRDRRVTVIRFRADFAERVAASASPRTLIADLRQMFVLADLQHMFAQARPMRIVIDPLSPFLSDGGATGPALDALVDWLDACGATALLSWNGDVAAGADRRLERLLERSAVIVRTQRLVGHRFRAEVIRARHAVAHSDPIDFEIRPGVGLVPAQPDVPTSSGTQSQSLIFGDLTPLVGDTLRVPTDRGQPPA